MPNQAEVVSKDGKPTEKADKEAQTTGAKNATTRPPRRKRPKLPPSRYSREKLFQLEKAGKLQQEDDEEERAPAKSPALLKLGVFK